MPDLLICHYEDEPAKVDFPGMIEVALFGRSKFTDCTIEEPKNDGLTFIIKFTLNDKHYTLNYLIGTDLNEIVYRTGKSVNDAILHMVDMSIHGDNRAGVTIVANLLSQGIASEKIWVVTAYEALARDNQFPSEITIYPKPSSFDHMTQLIIDMLTTGELS